MKLLLVVLCVVIVAASAKVIVIDNDYDHYKGIGEHKVNKPVSAVVTQQLYIPMTLKDCDNASCQAACEALGYSNGVCVSPTTCDCY